MCLLTCCNVLRVCACVWRQIKAGARGVKTEKNEQCGRRERNRKGKWKSRESPACVLVPSPVRALSARDLWHWDWEQSSLPAQYCYNWQLMRPDGLSSTALNRGLHLHKSRALPFLFPAFSSPTHWFLLPGWQAAAWRGAPQNFWEVQAGVRQSTEIKGRHSVTAALSLSSRCMLLSLRLSSYKWGREREGESSHRLCTSFSSQNSLQSFAHSPESPGVLYLQHLWPQTAWTSFYNQYQSLWQSCLAPPQSPPSASGFLSFVINGTKAPVRLMLPVPAMFPWYLMNSDKLLFLGSVVLPSAAPPLHSLLHSPLHSTALPPQHLGVSPGPLWIPQEAGV